MEKQVTQTASIAEIQQRFNVLKNAFSLHSPIVFHKTQLHVHKAKPHFYNLYRHPILLPLI
jgi:hypothetical protein